MPYAKRSFKRYKRRAPYRKRTYTKRRKVSVRRRPYSARKRLSKRLPLYAQRAMRGAFSSLGNKSIRDKKLGVVKWMSPFTNTISAIDVVTTGRVLFAQNTIDVTSGVFNAPYQSALTSPESYFAENWNQFACRYQRAKVQTAHVTCQFFIQDESDIQYLNSDYFLVGLYVSREQILPSMTGVSGDWQKWKRMGNFTTKKYVKNASGWLSVSADINVPACMAADDITQIRHKVWSTDKFVQDGVGVVPLRLQNSYFVLRLYCTPFVVPLTRVQSAGGSNINIQYRVSTKKRVLFDRPIVNAQGLLGTENYPPIRSDLPPGYTPLDSYDSKSAILALETRMDLDDIEDSNLEGEITQINFMDTAQNGRLDDIEADQILQDQNTATQVSILNDSIDDNTTLIQQHQALPANQAHG